MTQPRSFATLTPANVVAKIAFSDLVETGSTNESLQPRRNMVVNPEKTYDKDALHWRLEQERQYETDKDDETASPTEPDSDTERSLRHKGLLWTGSYLLSFDRLPQNSTGAGWIVGKAGSPLVDLVLATRKFSQAHIAQLRTTHAYFNFSHERAALLVGRYSRSVSTELTVGGQAVTNVHYLNQSSMKIRISGLEYDFSYAPFASTSEYNEKLMEMYLPMILHAPHQFNYAQIPTPQGQQRTIGQWTLGEPLGKGAEGNVFSASDRHGDVVAVKVVVRMRQNESQVNGEIETLKTLTTLSKTHDQHRIVRLRQVIYQRDTAEFNASSGFDEVALILEPYAVMTMAAYIKAGKDISVSKPGMSLPAANLFRQLLLAVEFLHKHRWLHGDIKPDNIGITGTNSTQDIVLLDVGRCKRMNENITTFAPTPGFGGTVRYLAPERELQHYNHLVDIWSLGITGFELANGYHPWALARNPWRPGEGYEALRSKFHLHFEDAMTHLSPKPELEEEEGRLNVDALLRQLLTHPWANSNNQARISATKALQHPSWEALVGIEDKHASKKLR